MAYQKVPHWCHDALRPIISRYLQRCADNPNYWEYTKYNDEIIAEKVTKQWTDLGTNADGSPTVITVSFVIKVRLHYFGALKPLHTTKPVMHGLQRYQAEQRAKKALLAPTPADNQVLEHPQMHPEAMRAFNVINEKLDAIKGVLDILMAPVPKQIEDRNKHSA